MTRRRVHRFISDPHQLRLDERIHAPANRIDLNGRELRNLPPAERDRGLEQAGQDTVALTGGFAGEHMFSIANERRIGELSHETRFEVANAFLTELYE